MADLETALRAALRRIDALETEVIAPLVATVQLLDRKVRDSSEDEEPGVQKGHQPWKCEGCRGLLGYYDTVRDVLRIRVKDYHVQVQVGEKGWVEVPCRRCGHPNRQGYSPPRG
jgi:hypothetical protein